MEKLCAIPRATGETYCVNYCATVRRAGKKIELNTISTFSTTSTQPTIKRPTLSSSRGRLHINRCVVDSGLICQHREATSTSLRGPFAAQQQYPFAMHTNNSPPPWRAQTYENFASTHHSAAPNAAANRSSIDLIIFFRQKSSTGCTMLQILIGSIPFSLMVTYSKIIIMARAPRCPTIENYRVL